jgi:conjugal transfer protein trbG
MRQKFIAAIIAGSLFTVFSCRTTVDMEKRSEAIKADKKNDIVPEPIVAPVPEKEIVYVEAPNVISGEVSGEPGAMLEGSNALKEYLKNKTELPKYFDNQLKAWIYKPESIYQVHTQVYHSTIIQLEPGEEMLETPYISEPDVWRISRGVGLKNGLATQFLIVKPDFSGLDSTLIIITNLRVYQMQLKSYKDHYMPYVKWVYNNGIEDLSSWKAESAKQNGKGASAALRAANMSFDYEIRYTKKKKPVWCPTLIYDDGQKTYIVLDEKSLNMETPAVFKNNSDIVNSQVDKNVIILNELIEKVTLKLGWEKVIITKKKKAK